VVATSVTNMDIHDIARTARTYDVKGVFIVTPIPKQRELVETILTHWRQGYGAAYNPSRKEAFRTVHVAGDLKAVTKRLSAEAGKRPWLVATGADPRGPVLTYEALREKLRVEDGPSLMVFGTGWGIAQDIMTMADYILEPIQGPTSFNHLPVRAAVAITLDRLAGLRA